MKAPDPAHPEAEGVLTVSDCDSLFEPFKSFDHIVLAVSGGVDSTLLLVLMHEWVQRCGVSAPKLSVATVDHALRPASRGEAESVRALAAKLALPATVLTWQGDKPRTGVQAAAREARYRLLFDHAKAVGADALAVAHHADDQSETVLMRLCAGSGLDGLSGMQPRVFREGLSLLRPLLGIGKQPLLATARGKGLDWVDDPSNFDDKFLRVRFRKGREVLASAGLDAVRLNRLARRMARAQDALEQVTDRYWQDVAMVGHSEIVLSGCLFDAPDEIRIRLLMRACAKLAPDAAQRLERFETLMTRLAKGDANGSIAGCLVRMQKGQLRVTRELPRRRGRKFGV